MITTMVFEVLDPPASPPIKRSARQLDALERRRQRELDELFAEVRRACFPRWDREGRWSVVHDPAMQDDAERCHLGRCDVGARRLAVASAGRAIIVHAICHALTGPNHDARWRSRMRNVAARARTVGEAAFAMELIEDEALARAPRPCHRQNARSAARR